jgi:hypothetical protein
MREQAGRIVLMDFGAGGEIRLLEGVGQSEVVGTPMYMAPEVLNGKPASIRSDIYSVGVLLYHLASSEYPFGARSMSDLREAHRMQDRRFLAEIRPDLPAAFVRVVERCLSAEPSARYGNMGEVLEALSRVLGTEPAVTDSPNRLMRALTGVAAALAIATALGLLNTLAFNVTLGRSEFAAESPWDWFVWGIRSSLGPLSILFLGAVMVALFDIVRGLLVKMSSKAAELDAIARRVGGEWAARLSLDEPASLSSWVFVVSFAALAGAWWWFWPLLAALGTNVSTGPMERLTLLSPQYQGYQASYRQVFSVIVIGTAALWYGFARMAARRGQRVPPAVRAGAAAVMFLSFASLDFPYRLLLHNEFEAAAWNEQSCYVLGERAEDILLFCPNLAPPRNRVVPLKAGTVQRLGRRESLFTGLNPISK